MKTKLDLLAIDEECIYSRVTLVSSEVMAKLKLCHDHQLTSLMRTECSFWSCNLLAE